MSGLDLNEYRRRSDIFQSGGLSRVDSQVAAGMSVAIDALLAPKEQEAPAATSFRRKRSQSKRERDEIRARDGDNCWLCGNFVDEAHESTEHLDPVSRGGSESLENKRLTHRACNQDMRNMTREEKKALRDERRKAKP